MAVSVSQFRRNIPWDRSHDPAGVGTFSYEDQVCSLDNTLRTIRVYDGPWDGNAARTITDRLRLDGQVRGSVFPANLEVQVFSRWCDDPGNLVASVVLALPAAGDSSGMVLQVSGVLTPSWEIRARLSAGIGQISFRAWFDRVGPAAAAPLVVVGGLVT